MTQEKDLNLKFVIGSAASIILIGIWVGTIQANQMQARTELDNLWKKYNIALDQKNEATNLLTAQAVEILYLKQEIEEIKEEMK